MLACFDAWYEREGKGNYEERQILQRAADFIQSKGNSEMFGRLESIGIDGGHQTSRYHAGYVEQRNGYPPVYYLTREAFESEICGGYDKDFVCKVLYDAGWLQKSSNRWTKQLKRAGISTAWFYVLAGDQPPQKEPAEG